MSSDEFSVVEDPLDRFYTTSTDGKGHSDELRVRVPQGISALVSEVRSAYPQYKSNADFIRDSVIQMARIRTERLKDPSIQSKLERSRALAEMTLAVAGFLQEDETKRALLNEIPQALACTDIIVRQTRLNQIRQAAQVFGGQFQIDVERFLL